MTTESSGPEPAGGGLDNAAFVQVSQTPEFERLRRTFRRFVFPMTVAFLAWYLLYVLLSAYARGFMGTKLFGEINVALVFGVLQFASTFLIAWAYERYSTRTLEPLADTVRTGILESAGGGATAAGPAADPGTDTDKPVMKKAAAGEPAKDAEPAESAEGKGGDEPAEGKGGDEPSEGGPAGDGPAGEKSDGKDGKDGKDDKDDKDDKEERG